MKKRVVVIALGFALCNSFFGPQKTSQARDRRQPSIMHDLGNWENFQYHVKRMARVYANNPAMFVKFMNGRTPENFTPLMYVAAVADNEGVAFILDQARRVVGNNKEYFFEIANAQDEDANTALFLAALSGHVPTIETIVNNVASVLNQDKILFLKFLTPSFGKSGWTPLHALAFGSNGEAIRVLVLKAEAVLGKGSDAFNSFINAQDGANGTPLSYVLDPSTRFFLIEHGATIYHSVSPEKKKAMELGDKLINAVKNDDFVAFQETFKELDERYKNSKAHYLEAVSKRDGDGWNAFMHAAAHNRMDFISIFMKQVGDFFGDDINSIYTIISNTAVDGRTALLIAIFRRNFEAATLILDLAAHYSKNKFFFYMFLNVVENYNGFTPLLSAVYNSASGGDEDQFYTLIKKMLVMIDKRFHDSYIFTYFINALDNNDNTALSYANVPKIRELLIDYGAYDPKAHTHMRTRYVG